jgi:hypothetical protein
MPKMRKKSPGPHNRRRAEPELPRRNLLRAHHGGTEFTEKGDVLPSMMSGRCVVSFWFEGVAEKGS